MVAEQAEHFGIADGLAGLGGRDQDGADFRRDRQAAPRFAHSLRLLGDGRQLEHVELRSALRPWDDQPPAERPDAFEHAGHVALGIVAIGQRLVLVAERKAAEEDQPVGIVIVPQAGPPGAGCRSA